MKVNQKGKGNDEFCTPDFLFNQLHARFAFNLDAACTTKNCKVYNHTTAIKSGCFIDKKQDGLVEPWSYYRVFCNPPFSNKGEWIKKAHDEVLSGNCPLVVMILPTNSMDSKPWHQYIYGKFHYEILDGRVSFLDKKGKPMKGNNSGTTIVYFWKKPETKERK